MSSPTSGPHRRHRNLAALTALIALMVFAADPSRAAPTVSWGEAVDIAEGPAHMGPWRMNESDWRFVDDPTVALDRQGRVAVAWVDQSRKDVYFRFHKPDGTAPVRDSVNVSRSPGIFSWLPRVVTVPGGHVYVLWQEIVFSGGSHGGEIFFSRSTDDGQSFGEPINLSNSTAGDGKGRLSADYWHNGSLDLAQGPDGTLYAAWTEYEGRLWLSASRDDGRSFDDAVLVAGGPGDDPARGPALATGDDGRVYLAWTVGEDRRANVHLAVSSDGGRTFGKPRQVVPGPGHADAPRIALDERGTLHLVYAESPSGPLRRYRIRYTRSVDGMAFAQPRTLSDPLPAGYASAGFPGLSVADADTLHVLWHLSRDPRQRPRALGFAVSGDGGLTFTAPSRIPGVAQESAGGIVGSLQGLLVRKLAASAKGTVAVVNSVFVPNQRSVVRLVTGNIDKDPGQ